MTCFLTESRIQPDGYYRTLESDKLEQALSTLHSLKVISFSSSEIRIELDDPYSQRRELLEERVSEWHPRASFFSDRLDSFKGWAEAVSRIPPETDWVLLMANHDHVFVQNEPSQFTEYLLGLDQDGRSTIAHISHWTEAIGWRILKCDKSRPTGFQLWFDSPWTIGTVAVKLEELKSWFKSDFTGGSKFVRPDNPFGPSVVVTNPNQSLPLTEFFRHLDGYGHVGLNAPYTSVLRPCVKVDEGQVSVDEYRVGLSLEGNVDLLRTPKFYSEKSEHDVTGLTNLLTLATGYRVRPRILLALCRATNLGLSSKLASIFGVLRTPRFWQSLAAPALGAIASWGRR